MPKNEGLHLGRNKGEKIRIPEEDELLERLEDAGGKLDELEEDLYERLLDKFADEKMTPAEVVAELSKAFEKYYRKKAERKEPAVGQLRERAARFIHALILDPWAAREAKHLWRKAHPDVEMWPYLPTYVPKVDEDDLEKDE